MKREIFCLFSAMFSSQTEPPPPVILGVETSKTTPLCPLMAELLWCCREHASLVYWSQTRNTRTFVPDSPLFIVMACEQKEAGALLSNSAMGHPPQMRLSPKALNSSSALIQHLLQVICSKWWLISRPFFRFVFLSVPLKDKKVM